VSGAPAWVVGVDGGASRGRAWAAPADHDPARPPRGHAERDGACNPYAVGVAPAAAAILAVIDAAWSAAGAPADGLSQAFVTVGLAGADRDAEREPLLRALFASGLAADRFELRGDPWVALEGALPAEEVTGGRVLLVSGTGSVAVARCDDGREARVGGWGSRVGDEGSGAWLGIEAVRATLRALDGRDESGPLAAAVQAAWGDGSDALVGRAREAAPADFAALAPQVLRQADDPVACALRGRAVAYLAELVTAAAAACPRDPAGIALAGGVASALAEELRAALPEPLAAALRPAVGPPVAGAWRMARRRALAAAERYASPATGRPAR
jgi:N-acetylglucosamine kinase-like BadF-type ATPase